MNNNKTVVVIAMFAIKGRKDCNLSIMTDTIYDEEIEIPAWECPEHCNSCPIVYVQEMSVEWINKQASKDANRSGKTEREKQKTKIRGSWQENVSKK